MNGFTRSIVTIAGVSALAATAVLTSIEPLRAAPPDEPAATVPAAATGHATDAQDGTLPGSALTWKLIMHHCMTLSDCHTHLIQTFQGASGSFTAPDHEYPCWIELQLTATDSGGLSSTTSVRLDPRTVVLTFLSMPSSVGRNLVVNGTQHRTPFRLTVVDGSENTVSAPSPQKLRMPTYLWKRWSDRGARTHTITATPAAPIYAAMYRTR